MFSYGFQSTLFGAAFLLVSSASFALDRDVEVDILEREFSRQLAAEKHGDALVTLEKLRALVKDSSERADYRYVVQLNRANSKNTLSVAEAYIVKNGRTAAGYGEVLDIVSKKRQEAKDSEASIIAGDKARKERFSNCVTEAKSIERFESTYDPNSTAMHQYERGFKLKRLKQAFNSDCGHFSSDLDADYRRSACSHPAYQSDWCRGQ